MKKTLYLIDGHSLTFKAYYAIRNLTSPQGESTGAAFGFLRMLLGLLDRWGAEYLAVVFDTGKPTFRNEMYPLYKANREAPPEDFSVQMGWILELLGHMGLAVFQKEGFEADDLIGTMAAQAAAQGEQAVFLSADKDLMQLVGPGVKMLRPSKDQMLELDEAGVAEQMGVFPDQIADWLALVGDSSDNIPGVPGIGAKTATSLLEEYKTLENMLAQADQLKRPRQREALQANADQARLARQLATIKCDVPVEWNWDQCRLPGNMWTSETCQLMVRLGFHSILRERGVEIPSQPAAARTHAQDDFFGLPMEGEESPQTQAAPVAAAPSSVQTEYRTISQASDLEAWVREALQGCGPVALDTETTSTDAMRAQLVGISLCAQPGRAIYIPVGHRPEMAGCGQLELAQVRELLAPVLGPGGARLTAHHAKYDWKILRRAGFTLSEPSFDSMIASYLLDPDKESGHGLKALGMEVCGVAMQPISELIGRGRDSITMDQVPVEQASPYACADADVTLRLMQAFEPRLEARAELKRLMNEVELPLAGVLLEMEMGGFRVDVDVLAGLRAKLDTAMSQTGRAIFEAAGHPFNIGSPKQVAQVLYEEFKLPTGKKGKTGYSTNEEELERLALSHEIARLILEYRGCEKLRSTYVDSLPRMVHPQTGRIHTSFNQTIAATGRLTSTDPNLQNIPIRTELGREIRRAFVADEGGHRILKADYSQIELRILAHVSGDETLRSAYQHGRDIHRQTASEVFGVPADQVTPQMRSEAKAINFGIIYGMSAHGLARQLGISRTQAAQFIDRYFNTYPGVRQWIDTLLVQARKDGWVQTLLGRRRPLPGLAQRNSMVRSNAERMAVNTPIQGTSADMIKLAMIRIQQGLHEHSPGARMVCQVHDELVFSVPVAQLGATADFVAGIMCSVMPLEVPLEVDLSVGENWADCTAWKE